MWDEILKAATLVYFPTMLKFILGPIAGYYAKLNIATTIIASVAGMMTVVIVVTYSGDWFKKHILDRLVKKRDPARQATRIQVLWRKILMKYGLSGVAFFTPLFLTPIGGSILALSLNKPKEKIIFVMFISAASWGIAFTLGIYFFLDQIKDWLDYVR